MTYSVVVRDPVTGALGVAAQSHYFAVGAVVPWAEAGVGAVATQYIPDLRYGARGLDALRAGATAADALRRLLAEDAAPELRQVAMVDAHGGVAAHTGARCVRVAGSRTGDGWSVQGNMLTAEHVLDAMAAALTESAGDLPRRLVAALHAAEDAGGDLRGSQAAALRVVSGARIGEHGVLVDLRVDDAEDAVAELDRLLTRHEATAALGVAFGLVVDGDTELGVGVVDAVLAGLARAEVALGPDNPEVPLWRAVLLARSGRLDAARRELATAVGRQPRLRDIAPRLADAGFLSAAAAAALSGPP